MSAIADRFMELEEYLALDKPVNGKDELIEGELHISPSAFPDHMEVAHQIQRLLEQLVNGRGFVVRQDTSILLEKAEPASMPRPDVFVFSEARWRECVRNRTWPEGAPVLAVDVFSPGNRKSKLRKKIDLFLRKGSSAVWAVYPITRVVQVCTSDGDREYKPEETIALMEPLPPGEVAVAKIFETLS
jgi:Uma2 family endonuclease